MFRTEADVAPLDTTRSRAKAHSRALPRDEALAYVTGDDRRPLVVMRECGYCEGSDDALLSTRLDNERTLLLSNWFHLVKLPNHVLEADHPFRNLFDGEQPPHLVVMSRDGSLVRPLSGQQSQTELWSALEDVLAAAYEGEPGRSVQRIVPLLDRLDELDQEGARLNARFNEELEQKGEKSAKLRRMRQDIEEHEQEVAETRRSLEALRSLPLRTG